MKVLDFLTWLSTKVKVKSLSRVGLFATLWTIAHQALLSMGFSRQDYWSGLPFPSPGDLPDPGIEPRSPALEADALTSEPPGRQWMWQREKMKRVLISLRKNVMDPDNIHNGCVCLQRFASLSLQWKILDLSETGFEECVFQFASLNDIWGLPRWLSW